MTDDPDTAATRVSAAGTRCAPPCTLIIFGAGGDLTKRLLIPSVYNLACAHLLPDTFSIIGVDIVKQDAAAWRAALTAAMQSFTQDKTAEAYTPELDSNAWQWVGDRLHYVAGDFKDAATFDQLQKTIGAGSAIFYLAVAARFFATVVEGLGKAHMFQEPEGAFRRLVIEKPFGSDLPSAQALNAAILAQADEKQVYRIDHFLGKETVQSIMAVRFGNGMFEPTWRREYIDHVQITAAETVGVEMRGSFYESTGALRDMVPNHLFTLLSMVAMDPPNSFDADDVRTEKARVAKAMRPVQPADAVRGQYGPGEEAGKPVAGYRQEPNVSPQSTTETYVALKVYVENWRWTGVPFYLRTGKRMAGRRTEITIHYKPAPYRMFRDTRVDELIPNIVRIQIDPEQGIETQFMAKVPGPEMRLGRVEMSMHYKDFFKELANVGYETLLYDCMMGDATLFQRADAIEAGWAAVQPLLDAWGHNQESLESYAAGSEGPAAADQLLTRDGRQWLKLGE
jgi:glucose-6-phosphate 1-dehydrogenase